MKTILILLASVLLGGFGGLLFRQARTTNTTRTSPGEFSSLAVEAPESMQFHANDPQLGVPFILKPQGSGSIMNPAFSKGQITMRFLYLAQAPGLKPGAIVEIYGLGPQGREEVYWNAHWQGEERFELPPVETEVLVAYGELFFRADEGESRRPLGSMTINPNYAP